MEGHENEDERGDAWMGEEDVGSLDRQGRDLRVA